MVMDDVKELQELVNEQRKEIDMLKESLGYYADLEKVAMDLWIEVDIEEGTTAADTITYTLEYIDNLKDRLKVKWTPNTR
jgi:hypothetical protein